MKDARRMVSRIARVNRIRNDIMRHGGEVRRRVLEAAESALLNDMGARI